jgi:hypothetical protein
MSFKEVIGHRLYQTQAVSSNQEYFLKHMLLPLSVVFLSAAAHTPVYLAPQTQHFPDPANWLGYRYCEVAAAWLDGLSVSRNAFCLIL